MNLTFDRGISAVKALKDEYDALSVEVVKKQSHEENLKQFISEKGNKIVDLKRENVQLDEKLISTERQVESIEATIQHYREIKRSLVADVQQKEENLNDMRKKLAANVEKTEKDIESMQSILDHATNEVWSKKPGFSDMMSLAQKSAEIDAQIEAATKRKEEMIQAIAEAEQRAAHEGSREEHQKWMQEELQKIEQRNAQKMSTLQNLEEKLATLENARQEKIVEKAMAKQKNLALLSPQRENVVDNQKGDDRDEINDSGMDTMYFQDSPENQDHETTTEVHVPRPDFDRTIGPRPGPAAQSTPAVMDSLKGLVDTVKVNKMMLETNQLTMESPIAHGGKSLSNLPCHEGNPNNYANPNVFKTPRPAALQNSDGMAQSTMSMGLPRPQQNFATSTASAPYQSPNSYENQDVFKPPRPGSHQNSDGMAQSMGLPRPHQNSDGMAQSMGLPRPQQIAAAANASYQSPNSYGNQDVFKTPRRTSNQNSGTPYKSPMGDELKTPKQMVHNPLQTTGKSRSQRRLLVESNEEDAQSGACAQFSFHEENLAIGNLGSETMGGNISKQASIFDAPGDPMLKMSPGLMRQSPGLTKQSPGLKKAGSVRGSPAATITSPTVGSASGSDKNSNISSPPNEHPFGVGFGPSSGTKFDFFGSGGMFGGSSQEETGTGNGGDFQAGSFPSFNFTGLDTSINKGSSNDIGGFGFNF